MINDVFFFSSTTCHRDDNSGLLNVANGRHVDILPKICRFGLTNGNNDSMKYMMTSIWPLHNFELGKPDDVVSNARVIAE